MRKIGKVLLWIAGGVVVFEAATYGALSHAWRNRQRTPPPNGEPW